MTKMELSQAQVALPMGQRGHVILHLTRDQLKQLVIDAAKLLSPGDPYSLDNDVYKAGYLSAVAELREKVNNVISDYRIDQYAEIANCIPKGGAS